MANRLQLKRGTGAPGSIFYAGEPIYDQSGKILYVGDTGGTGTGAGSSVASAEAYSTILEMLTKASNTTAGAIKFYEDTDNGSNFITLKAPAAVTADITLTLPDSDGDDGQVLKTDGSGNLSWVSQTSGYSGFNISDGSTTQEILSGNTITFSAGEGIDVAVSATDTVTISAEIATTTNAGIASFTSTDFTVGAGGQVSLDSERIQDIVGGMLTGNTETNITVTYEDGDGTIDFSVADATDSIKGVASFDLGDFVVTSGAVALGSTFVNTVTTDSGALTPSNHGFSILGGEGMDVTHTSSTITVAGEDASDTNKGIASFSSDFFTVNSGAVTLKSGAAGIVTSISGTANEVEVTNNNNGTYTIGLPNDVTIGNDLTVNGNLRVVGTAVTFETETVRVEDRLIELGIVAGAEPTATTTWDSGVAFNYFQTSAKKSGVIWLNNQFMAMLSELSDGGGTDNDSPQITATAYAPVAAGGLYIGGIASGNEVINSSQQAVNLVFDGGTY